MIRIALVEDEAEVRAQLQGYVQRHTRQYGTEFAVTEFADGMELLDDYRPVYDILFLDVEMKHLDGMETARRVRELDKDVIIVFITNMAQYAIGGYAVGALDYVLKPVPYFAFSQQLLFGIIWPCRWRAGCGGWIRPSSIIWKARDTASIFIPKRAISWRQAP